MSNGTLFIYNQTGLYNSTFFTTISGMTQALVGIVVYLVDGIYTWFYQIVDSLSFTQTSQNQTLTIDTTAPIITLINPNSSYTSNSNYVTFAYLINNTPATTSISNVSLYIDGVLNFTWTNPTVNIEIQNYTKLSYGYHNWTINAYDGANNLGTSTSTFFIGDCNCSAVPTINGSLVVYPNQTLVIRTCGK
jgi:hypothetical protein